MAVDADLEWKHKQKLRDTSAHAWLHLGTRLVQRVSRGLAGEQVEAKRHPRTRALAIGRCTRLIGATSHRLGAD